MKFVRGTVIAALFVIFLIGYIRIDVPTDRYTVYLVADKYRNVTGKSDLDLHNDPLITVKNAIAASNTDDFDSIPDRLLELRLDFRCVTGTDTLMLLAFRNDDIESEPLYTKYDLDFGPLTKRQTTPGTGPDGTCLHAEGTAILQ